VFSGPILTTYADKGIQVLHLNEDDSFEVASNRVRKRAKSFGFFFDWGEGQTPSLFDTIGPTATNLLIPVGSLEISLLTY
jgi:hypothetical protein